MEVGVKDMSHWLHPASRATSSDPWYWPWVLWPMLDWPPAQGPLHTVPARGPALHVEPAWGQSRTTPPVAPVLDGPEQELDLACREERRFMGSVWPLGSAPHHSSDLLAVPLSLTGSAGPNEFIILGLMRCCMGLI